jgi:hypothetical protein
MYIKRISGTITAENRNVISVRIELEKITSQDIDINKIRTQKRSIAFEAIYGSAGIAAGMVRAFPAYKCMYDQKPRPPRSEDTPIGNEVRSTQSEIPKTEKSLLETGGSETQANWWEDKLEWDPTTSAEWIISAGSGVTGSSVKAPQMLVVPYYPEYNPTNEIPGPEQSFIESCLRTYRFVIIPRFPGSYSFPVGDAGTVNMSIEIVTVIDYDGVTQERLKVEISESDVVLYKNFVNEGVHYKIVRDTKANPYTARYIRFFKVTRSATEDSDSLDSYITDDEKILSVSWVNDDQDGSGTHYDPVVEYTYDRLNKNIVWLRGEETVAMTRGGTPNTADNIPAANLGFHSVAWVSDNSDGSSPYTLTTDYLVTPTQIDWSPGGSEPSGAATYYVRFRYIPADSADYWVSANIVRVPESYWKAKYNFHVYFDEITLIRPFNDTSSTGSKIVLLIGVGR